MRTSSTLNFREVGGFVRREDSQSCHSRSRARYALPAGVQSPAQRDGPGRRQTADQVRAISDMAEIHYIRQKMPLGLGHAISVAEQHIGDEPFAVLLGDDLIGEQENLLGDMADAFNRHQTSVIAAMEVPLPKIKLYGAVAPGEEVEPGLFRLTDIVEKPDPERAPSNLAVIGRYVLHPEIFTALRATEPDAKGEIQLSDALKRVVDTDGAQGVLAQRFT